MGLLENKVAVITGGASGIGEESVRQFVAQGAYVLIGDIQDDRGEALADELGEQADYQHCDVTSEVDIQAIIETASSKTGQLDILFNNAGITGPNGEIETAPLDHINQTISILLTSVILGIKHAAPIMKAQQSGSIINTASVAGLGATFGPHVYSAAKAGVVNLTRSVAVELGTHFVRVNAICPGGIATPIFARSYDIEVEAAQQTVDVMKRILRRQQPIPRAGVPRDIADLAVFLGSDMSSFITGQAIAVDGGMTTGRYNWPDYQAGQARMGEILNEVTSQL